MRHKKKKCIQEGCVSTKLTTSTMEQTIITASQPASRQRALQWCSLQPDEICALGRKIQRLAFCPRYGVRSSKLLWSLCSPEATRVQKNNNPTHTPSTGLRHPPFKECAGKRCSECDNNRYPSLDRKCPWKFMSLRQTSISKLSV